MFDVHCSMTNDKPLPTLAGFLEGISILFGGGGRKFWVYQSSRRFRGASRRQPRILGPTTFGRFLCEISPLEKGHGLRGSALSAFCSMPFASQHRRWAFFSSLLRANFLDHEYSVGDGKAEQGNGHQGHHVRIHHHQTLPQGQGILKTGRR